MPATVPIQFGSTMARSDNGAVTLESLVNLYLEANPQGAKGPTTLRRTPGLKLWSTVGDGPCRGIHVMGSDIYIVSGPEIYAVDRHKAATLVGTIAGNGHVRMTNNGTHVAVASSSKLYAVNRDGVVELPQSNMNGATYQDGYGIFTEATGNGVWITGLDDMTAIDPLDFTTADALTGNCRGVISNHRQVWVFKEDNAEAYDNTGGVFPFSRSAVVEVGCLSPHSLAKAQGSVFWLGHDYRVYAMQGYQPTPVSTPTIEQSILDASGQSAAVGWTYMQGGHTHYVLTMADLTVVYDSTTGLWHERESYELGRWRAVHYGHIADLHLVGDVEDGSVYELDQSTYDDNGDPIVWRVTAPPLHAAGNRAHLHELFIDMETGVGLNDGQGSDPSLVLDWTDDAGHTWSSEVVRSAGKIGEYRHRAVWTRLGGFRQRTLRLSGSDPVNIALIGAYARIEGGAS